MLVRTATEVVDGVRIVAGDEQVVSIAAGFGVDHGGSIAQDELVVLGGPIVVGSRAKVVEDLALARLEVCQSAG